MIIGSPNFGEIEITGIKEKKASEWLTKELEGVTKAQEILLHREAMHMFNVSVSATNSHIEGKEHILHCLL